MLLSELAANAELKYDIAEAMKNRTLPHAILIEGVKGSGKKTLAQILAQYAVCSGEGNRPCGVCPDCIKAQKGIHPDIFIADGTKSGELNIEAVRQIRSAAYIKPNEAQNRVFLLYNTEKMLAPAQNAFLKVLEEPPPNVLFVLTSVSATAMLQTVRSRTRILTMYPPTAEEALQVLQKMFPEEESEKLAEAATSSGGNIGEAVSLLNNKGEEEKQMAADIFKALLQTAEYPLLIQTNQAVRDRAFAAGVLERLYELSAECVKASYGAAEVSETAKELAGTVSKKRLCTLQENITKARDLLNYNVNLNLYGTWLCAVLRQN